MNMSNQKTAKRLKRIKNIKRKLNTQRNTPYSTKLKRKNK